jgi:hypothetical protein
LKEGISEKKLPRAEEGDDVFREGTKIDIGRVDS